MRTGIERQRVGPADWQIFLWARTGVALGMPQPWHS